jgi:ankyrin repeat protein
MSRDLEILKSVINVLEQSSSPKLNLKLLQTHACTNDGNTLLILAVIANWNEGADFFCGKGWNVDQKNRHGVSALEIARSHRDPSISILLRRNMTEIPIQLCV